MKKEVTATQELSKRAQNYPYGALGGCVFAIIGGYNYVIACLVRNSIPRRISEST